MKNKVSQLPKTWLSLYPFNIYNIQNPKIHAPQKGKYKMSIHVFQPCVNFQIYFGLENCSFWSFGKLQSFRSSSTISVAARIKPIWYRGKKIRPKYQNWS